MSDKRISRKEFIKKAGLGAFAFVLAGKSLGMENVHAAVSDNVGGSGGANIHIGTAEPDDKKMTWIDTGNDGVHKYWNGSAWIPVRSTWDA